MNNGPAIRLYVGDLLRESSYLGLSLAAQGLWVRMLMLMHDSPEFGYLVNANGSLMADANGMQTACKPHANDANAMQTPDANAMQNACKILANVVGRSAEEIAPLLAEMCALGTFSSDSEGRIYCRRMVRGSEEGETLSEKRSRAAKQRWSADANGMQTACKPHAKRHANDANDASSLSLSLSLSELSPPTPSLAAANEGGASAPAPIEPETADVADTETPETWPALVALARELKLRASDGELPRLQRIFHRLPGDEQLAALRGLELRRHGEYADPHWAPALARYLGERRWTAPERPPPSPAKRKGPNTAFLDALIAGGQSHAC
jgi:hypothetical protein